MKRIALAAAVCALALSLAACGSSNNNTAASAEATGYTGSQTAAAAGMEGDVSVTITWENGTVTACEIDASTETESIGQTAAPDLAYAIVEANYPEIDAVAGATVTSDAVVEAAKACFDAAEIAY